MFVEAREDVLRDRLVAARRRPHAAGGVAAAHVHRALDAAQTLEDHAVELGVRDELVRHVVPVLLERGAVAGVDVPLRVVGRVDLDVVAAELDQPIDDVHPQDAGDVADEVVRRRIRVGRVARRASRSGASSVPESCTSACARRSPSGTRGRTPGSSVACARARASTP